MSSVLGIGNALVDVIIRINSENYLKEACLPKGSMTMIDAGKVDSILSLTAGLPHEKASGGAVANTINGLANLGIQTGYIGTIGKDNTGEIFRKDMTGRKVNPHLFFSENTPTGRAITLVTGDGERTFGTYLGAALELKAADLDPAIFGNYQWLMAEGYLIYNRELISRALEIARENKLKIAMDMASYNLVEDNRDFITGLLNDYVDVVFANDLEAKALTGFADPETALIEMGKICRTAIVKLGDHGSLICSRDEQVHVNSVKANCIDTTGAGDLYAAGFLYGLIKGKRLQTCGEIGSLLGGNVVEVIGAKLSEGRWKKIKETISRMN
jgi:sugar/nucleoside kinase (ribokinase family)